MWRKYADVTGTYPGGTSEGQSNGENDSGTREGGVAGHCWLWSAIGNGLIIRSISTRSNVSDVFRDRNAPFSSLRRLCLFTLLARILDTSNKRRHIHHVDISLPVLHAIHYFTIRAPNCANRSAEMQIRSDRFSYATVSVESNFDIPMNRAANIDVA